MDQTQDEGLLLHVEHILAIVERLSGRAFLARVLARAGYPDPWDRAAAGHLSVQDEARLIRACAEISEDPAYPARLGLSYSTVTSVPGYVARNSRTLRSSILRSKRYTAFSAAALDYDLRETPTVSTLSIRTIDPAADRSFPHREFGLFAVLSIMRFVVQQKFSPVEITFRHRRSTGAEAIRREAGCPVFWDMPEDSIRLSPATLDLRIPTYDPRLRDLLVQHGETLLARAGRAQGSFRGRLEPLILDGFADGAPSADQIAKRLGMSRRTLTRRLSEEGLTFRHVLEDVRRDLATSYLKDTRLGLAEIAFQLGYSDQAAFTTAYRRWTGRTPSSERARRAPAAPDVPKS